MCAKTKHATGGWKHDRRSRQERGYGSAWDRLRQQILERDGYLCQVCLKQGRHTPLKVKPRDHAVDHIVPKFEGGTDDLDNLQAICAPCHEEKTDRESARSQGRKVKAVIGLDGWPID